MNLFVKIGESQKRTQALLTADGFKYAIALCERRPGNAEARFPAHVI